MTNDRLTCTNDPYHASLREEAERLRKMYTVEERRMIDAISGDKPALEAERDKLYALANDFSRQFDEMRKLRDEAVAECDR